MTGSLRLAARAGKVAFNTGERNVSTSPLRNYFPMRWGHNVSSESQSNSIPFFGQCWKSLRFDCAFARQACNTEGEARIRKRTRESSPRESENQKTGCANQKTGRCESENRGGANQKPRGANQKAGRREPKKNSQSTERVVILM